VDRPLPRDDRRLVSGTVGVITSMSEEEGRLSFLGKRIPPGFSVREVTVAPGARRAYDEAEWRDSLVVVERGAVEIECLGGARRVFERGNVLWLTGVPVQALHNTGNEPALLIAVSRGTEQSRR
jgi:quercetin dioxygenase-like cupin family protein